MRQPRGPLSVPGEHAKLGRLDKVRTSPEIRKQITVSETLRNGEPPVQESDKFA